MEGRGESQVKLRSQDERGGAMWQNRERRKKEREER